MINLILRQSIFWIFIFGALGCTSMQFSDYDQVVRVTSKKEGAEIRSGGQLLGTTPALIRLRRDKKPSITLNYPGSPPEEFALETKYRSGESALASLFFGPFAPIGIGVDLWTGTAWTIKDFEAPELKGKAPVIDRKVKGDLVIAPPIIGTPHESDQVGGYLETEFRREPRWKVRPFTQTLEAFEDANYTNMDTVDKARKNEIFAKLGATHAVESEVDRKAGKIKFKVTDILRDREEERGELNLPPLEMERGRLIRHIFSGLLPNTFSVELTNSKLVVDDIYELQSLESSAEPVAGWLGEFSKFAGTVGFSNLVPPRTKSTVAFKGRLVSSAGFSINEFSLESQTPTFDFTGNTYQRMRVHVGLGPEGYFETPLGVFYGHLLGAVGYTEIEYEGPLRSGNVGAGSLYTIAGLGWYTYMSDRISLRLFIRSLVENTRTWDMAIDRTIGMDYPTDSVGNTTTGISLGFYFPEVGRRFRH